MFQNSILMKYRVYALKANKLSEEKNKKVLQVIIFLRTTYSSY
jgi:hypothetical protein